MNLMDLLGQSAGQNAVGQIARELGIDERMAQQAVQAVLPAMGRGISRNAASGNGIGGLINALGKGSHERYVERPEVLGKRETIDDGNAILGHIFGNKEVSRNVAGRAAKETGVSSDIIKKMLPMVAAVAMGMLSKQTQNGRQLSTSTDTGGSGALGMLNQLLDADRDGSALDDVLSMAQRFF